MQNIHAKAPWRPDEGSYGNYVVVKDANGKTVARIPWGNFDNNHAHLISALPELLSSCKAIKYAMEETQGFAPNFLNDAIKKAEAGSL